MEAGQYKIGAIIQARLGSTRLPNKVLMPLGNGMTILSQIIYQLNKIKKLNKIIVATSNSQINNSLEKYTKDFNVDCYRGDEENVLSRFSNIIKQNDFDYVLRFTGDNPVVDTIYLDNFIQNVLIQKLDYCYSENLPLGCNFEMVKANLLVEANEKVTTDYDKEHVTPYVKRQTENKSIFEFPENSLFKSMRLTIDYPSDYSFLYLVSSMLKDKELNLDNIEFLIENNKWLLKINQNNFQKKEYKDIKEEISDLLPILQLMEMNKIEKKLMDEI